MTDLYKTLGVRRSATTETIRAAYRKKAKRAHPDTGGSPEAFSALKFAHDILTDPTARARYDMTGSAVEKPIDHGRGLVLALLSTILEKIVADSIQQDIDLDYVDMIAAARHVLSDHLRGIDQQIAGAIKRQVRYEKIAKRFSAKKGKENLFEAIMVGRLSTLAGDLAAFESQKAVAKQALELVDDHEFAHQTKKQAFVRMFVQAGSSSTTTYS